MATQIIAHFLQNLPTPIPHSFFSRENKRRKKNPSAFYLFEKINLG